MKKLLALTLAALMVVTFGAVVGVTMVVVPPRIALRVPDSKSSGRSS